MNESDKLQLKADEIARLANRAQEEVDLRARQIADAEQQRDFWLAEKDKHDVAYREMLAEVQKAKEREEDEREKQRRQQALAAAAAVANSHEN